MADTGSIHVERDDVDVHAAGPSYDLGVLFVHGIGKQQKGETLVRWGEALVDSIRQLGKEQSLEARIEVRAARLERDSETPSHAEVDIRVGDRTSTWLLAEGWWADSFIVPSYTELLRWGVQIAPWALALHFVRRIHRRLEVRQKLGGKIVTLLGGLPGFFLALLLGPLIVVALAVLAVIGLIPLTQVRSTVVKLQGLLTGTVGDSFVFVSGSAREAAIKTRAQEALGWVDERCREVAVIAHSQGAEVATQAFFSNSVFPRLRTLVTFGAGINKLRFLRTIARGGEAGGRELKIGQLEAWSPSLALLGLFVTAWFARRSVAAESLRAVDLLPAVLVVLGPFVVATLVVVARALTNKTVTLVTAALAFLVWVVSLFLAHMADVTVQLGSAGALLVGGTITLFSVVHRLSRTSTVLVPRSVDEVHDFYASHDPVPNGPTTFITSGVITSTEVQNFASPISDHTGYWGNQEQFVSRLAEILARRAKLPFRSDGRLQERRRANVVRFQWFRRAVLLAAVAWIGLSWDRLPQYGRWLQDLVRRITKWPPDLWSLGFVDGLAAQSAIGIALVLVVAMVVYGVGSVAWRLWLTSSS